VWGWLLISLPPRQALHPVGAELLNPGGMSYLRRVDPGQADGDGSAAGLKPQGVAVSHGEHRGSVAGRGGSDRGFAYPVRRRSRHRHGERGQPARGSWMKG